VVWLKIDILKSMNKRILIRISVCLLILSALRWVFFGPSSRLNVVESTIQSESEGNNVVGLSPIFNVNHDLVGSVALKESEPPEVEGITNTYSFSSNHVVTRVVIPNPEFKIFGTPKFESLAKTQFERLTINSKYIVDTNLYELREVFRDFPAAMNSQFLYSGIYQTAITTCTLREVRQFIFNTRYQAMRDLEEANTITDAAERESKIERIKAMSSAQLELYESMRQETLEDGRQNLIKLYGELPKPIFQRLLGIELRLPMGRLSYP
jgi:hypothetical protein